MRSERNEMRVIITFLILFTIGCSGNQSQLDETALNKFIRDADNGLFRRNEENGFVISLTWRPTDLLAMQQMEKGKRKEFDSLYDHFSKYIYFTLDVTKDGKDIETFFARDPENFVEKVSALSSNFGRDIQIITETDTVIALDCLYQRSYGIGASQWLVVFNRPKVNDFKVEVSGYGVGIGRQVFEFSLNNIEKAPRLKTKFL